VRSSEFNMPQETETVPNLMLTIVIVIYMVVIIWQGYQRRELHRSLPCYVWAFAMHAITCSFFKAYVGMFRPNFFESCGFDDVALECTQGASRVSCPSWHASASLCTGMLSFMISSRSMSQSPQKWIRRPGIIRTSLHLAALIPVGIAALIGFSRIVDNKHTPGDVALGYMVGAGAAGWSFCAYFTSDPGDSAHVLHRRGSVVAGNPRMLLCKCCGGSDDVAEERPSQVHTATTANVVRQ